MFGWGAQGQLGGQATNCLEMNAKGQSTISVAEKLQ
jgi:hypothetical protein